MTHIHPSMKSASRDAATLTATPTREADATVRPDLAAATTRDAKPFAVRSGLRVGLILHYNEIDW